MAMKTVLIITDKFPPGFAPRMGYLSKHLGEHGWKSIAISLESSNENHFDFLSGYAKKKVYIPREKIKISIAHKMRLFFFPDLRGAASVGWRTYKKMEDSVKELVEKEQIDMILCSTFGVFPLHIAYKTAKKYKIPWVADLRDMREQLRYVYEQKSIKLSFLKKLYFKSGIQRRNSILKKADAITSVSKKHIEFIKSYGLKAHCIYNGADTDIFIPSKHHKLDKFRIVYTGTLSSTTKNVAPLFSAIQQLYMNKGIDFNNCRVQFYTSIDSQKIVNKLKETFCISDFIDCFDYVPATEIPKILNESSILLLLLSYKDTGIMTTKFFEYLEAERPILCIWGEEGAVEDIINNSDAGIAAKTEDDIKIFIKMKYDEWLKTGYTKSDINREYIKNFSRRYNAKQFVELFDNILNLKRSHETQEKA